MNTNILNNVLSIVSGLCVCIPLVCNLIAALRNYHKEKNWSALVSIVSQYMAEAEKLYEKGADKKAYVMAAIESSGKLINYNVDMAVVSELIDSLCDLTKKLNVEIKEATAIADAG